MMTADRGGMKGRLNVSSGPAWEEWIRGTSFRLRITRSDLIAEAVKVWAESKGIDLPPDRSE